MSNEEQLAEIKEWIDQLDFDRCLNETHPGVILKVQLLVQEYEARIAAYEAEIKELKTLETFSYMDLATEVERRRIIIFTAGSSHGPPLGSTLLSESQNTLAAMIGKEFMKARADEIEAPLKKFSEDNQEQDPS